MLIRCISVSSSAKSNDAQPTGDAGALARGNEDNDVRRRRGSRRYENNENNVALGTRALRGPRKACFVGCLTRPR